MEEVQETPQGEPKAAWDGVRDQPILAQFLVIEEVVAAGEALCREVDLLIENGVRPEFGTASIELSAKDQQIIATALNLVGFFSGLIMDDADMLLERLIEAQKVSPEDELEINKASAKIRRQQLSEFLGVPVEELEKRRDGADAPEA